MIRTARRGAVLTAAATVSAIVAWGGVAAAHIDPSPAAVEAGAASTIGFVVEHGCEGSPTTGVDIKVPDGVTDAAPVAKDGWTATVDGGVVKFVGGPLDPETEATFSISLTAPATPGVINFPIVQTCEVGEIAWIEIPVEGQAEPDHPAPSVEVTDGPPTAGTVTTAADSGDTDSDDDDSSTTTVVVVVVIVLAAAAAGAWFAATRSRRSNK